MARIASFTSSGTPVGNRGTLAELMAKKKMLAEQRGTIEAPRQIESWTQGGAQLLQSFFNARQGAQAEQDAVQAREQLAGAMSGIDWSKGPTPEQLHAITTADPEAGQRIMEQSAQRALEELKYQRDVTRDDFKFKRDNADQVTDEARQAAAAAAVDRTKRGLDQSDQVADEARQAEAAKVVEAARIKAEQDKTAASTAAGQVRIVTGPEAAKFGGDPAKSYKMTADGTALEEVKPTAPGSPAGQLEKDIAEGVFGDPNDPANANRIAEARKTVQPKSANITRDQVWKMQDAYVNSTSGLSTLQEAAGLLDKGINWGWGAGLKTSFGKEGILGDKDLANRTDRYNKIMSREAIEDMSKTLAGADSDKDMQRFLFILNDETADPEVRKQALKGLIAKTQSFQELQKNRIIEGGGDVPEVRTVTGGVGDEAAALAEAQAAIDAGKDPAMVRKRFADKGGDPSKLKDKAGY